MTQNEIKSKRYFFRQNMNTETFSNYKSIWITRWTQHLQSYIYNGAIVQTYWNEKNIMFRQIEIEREREREKKREREKNKKRDKKEREIETLNIY